MPWAGSGRGFKGEFRGDSEVSVVRSERLELKGAGGGTEPRHRCSALFSGNKVPPKGCARHFLEAAREYFP